MMTVARSSAHACRTAGRFSQVMIHAHVDFLRGRLGQDDNHRRLEAPS